MRQALREALILLVAAIGLGVAYTWVTHQGFFMKVQSVPSPPNFQFGNDFTGQSEGSI